MFGRLTSGTSASMDRSAMHGTKKRSDLLIALLTAIGNELGYVFNPAQMQTYTFRKSHGARGENADAIQIGMAAVMRGKPNFPVEVKVSPEVAAVQADVLKALEKVTLS